MIIAVEFYLDSEGTKNQYRFRIFNETMSVEDMDTRAVISFPCRTLYRALLKAGLVPGLETKCSDDLDRYSAALHVIKAGHPEPKELAAKILADGK